MTRTFTLSTPTSIEPDMPPFTPHDEPATPEPMPLPADEPQPEPMREPESPPPMGDPKPAEPTRMM